MITKILETRKITTQHELGELLAEQGIAVTQTTLSRDLHDLGVHRCRDTEGHACYLTNPLDGELPATGIDLSRVKMLGRLLTTVTASGHLVVMRTPPGGGQLLASLLDQALLPHTLGCVGGNDTLVVVCSDGQRARSLAVEIEHMASTATLRRKGCLNARRERVAADGGGEQGS